MAESMSSEISDVLQNINRHVNCLGEENRNTRKRAIEGIKKEIFGRKPCVEGIVLQGVLSEIVKSLLKLLSDPVEKCRELTVSLLSQFLEKIPEAHEFLPFVIPVITQRLGQPELIEPSEELRLQLVILVQQIVSLVDKKIAPYLDDVIKILQHTIVDQYPEVKKESCKCASQIAKCIPEYFHMQSESLIKPLLQSISHQHSRVRVEVIKAIGKFEFCS